MTLATAAERVEAALAGHGITHLFGVPGTHAVELVQALHDGGRIRLITTRHEQGAAFMADGFARASGRLAGVIATTGPGVLNVATPVATAFADGSPMLGLLTQIPREHLGRRRAHVHEIEEQLDVFRNITCFRATAASGPDLLNVLDSAMRACSRRRRGPAVVEIPADVLSERCATHTRTQLGHDSTEQPTPDDEEMRLLAAILASARRPIIWAGSGAVDAGDEVLRLACALSAPVLTSIGGKAAIGSSGGWALGCIGLTRAGEELLRQSDVLLAVGTRFGSTDTRRWTLTLPHTVLRVDVDDRDFGRSYQHAAAVVGDVRAILAAISRQVIPSTVASQWRVQEMSEVRTQARGELSNLSAGGVEFVDGLRAAMPPKGILVGDVTIAAYWTWLLYDTLCPRTYLYPAHMATLGFALPAAIGAKLAVPEAPVLALCGDGGFLYSVMELATAAQYEVNLVVLLVNDSGYGLIRERQQRRFGAAPMSNLSNPDFGAVAAAFGWNYTSVEGAAAIGGAVRNAISQGGRTIVEWAQCLPSPI